MPLFLVKNYHKHQVTCIKFWKNLDKFITLVFTPRLTNLHVLIRLSVNLDNLGI